MSPRTGWAKHGALGGVPEEPVDRAGLATTGSLGGRDRVRGGLTVTPGTPPCCGPVCPESEDTAWTPGQGCPRGRPPGTSDGREHK